MDIQRKAFESSNNVNPDWSFKFDEELQQYIALDSEMKLQVDEFNEYWDTFRAGWEAKAQAVPASINDIRSWIAVNSFSALDAVHDNVPIVDANELAKYIDSLDLSVSVPEGFVLIKDDTKTVVAIERMVEQQVEASGMDSRRLERLDGWKIIEAAVKAQEPAND